MPTATTPSEAPSRPAEGRLRRRTSVLVSIDGGQSRLIVKGSPEDVLPLCAGVRDRRDTEAQLPASTATGQSATTGAPARRKAPSGPGICDESGGEMLPPSDAVHDARADRAAHELELPWSLAFSSRVCAAMSRKRSSGSGSGWPSGSRTSRTPIWFPVVPRTAAGGGHSTRVAAERAVHWAAPRGGDEPCGVCCF
jgi:hypothetical protein